MGDSKNIELLLKKVSEGDNQAFEKMFSIYHSQLYRFAFSFMKSKEPAEEVVMDLFLKLWNRKESLKSISNLETYLYVSIRNLSYTSLKKEKRLEFDPLEEAHVELARYEKTPEESLITIENIKTISEAIDTLPPKCKMIFKLIREDDLEKREVAQILDISVKTIDNQISIAVRKIAEVLQIDLTDKRNLNYLNSFLLTL